MGDLTVTHRFYIYRDGTYETRRFNIEFFSKEVGTPINERGLITVVVYK